MTREPRYPTEAPDDRAVTHHIAVGYCYDCRDVLGPGHAGDVSFELFVGEHELHETVVIDSWEVEGCREVGGDEPGSLDL